MKKPSIIIKKSGDQSNNPNKVRGVVRGGSFIKRIITGKDKDGSPQYRYIRTQEELKAWEEGQSKKKKTNKDGSKKKVVTLKEKVGKEHKKYTLLSRKSPKKDDEEGDGESTKKSLVIKVKNS